MGYNKNNPYNDLPLLPPAVEVETTAIMRKTISANKYLAELNGVIQTIPNASVLINNISLQEAKASSEIENIFTTNNKLYAGLLINLKNVDSHTKEVLNYRKALWKGYDEIKEQKPPPIMTTNFFKGIVQNIRENTEGVRKNPGTTISNSKEEVIYTPPEGEKIIRDKLQNLAEYINTDDNIDPLIKLAIIHYQFESIHPFGDGNGRTGRIINILYLVQKGLLDLPILYLSKYIIENKDTYYKLLKSVTEKNNWEEWILYMLNGVEQISKETRKKVEKIIDLMEKTIENVKQQLRSIYSKELVELLFKEPYTRINDLVENNIASRNIASNYLHSLADKGFLKPEKIGKEVFFTNTGLIKVLKGEI